MNLPIKHHSVFITIILLISSFFHVQCYLKFVRKLQADSTYQAEPSERFSEEDIAREAEAIPQFLTLISTTSGPFGVSYSLDLTDVSNVNLTYDYIVIGSGTAGSIVAGRLAEESPWIKVLLLEAGGPESEFTSVPFNHLLLQKTDLDWQYQGIPQKNCAFGLIDRGIPVPRGKLIGGCSAHNTMVYTRGNPKDYDRWAQLGAEGWSWPEVFPYFVKSESAVPDPSRLDPGYHGTRGPVRVTPFREPSTLERAILRAARQAGQPIGDYNGAQQRWSFTQYSIKDGVRVSMGRAYLARAQARGFINLDILTEAFVERIIFDRHRRAIGVEFSQAGYWYQVFASKEIILSAGTINSPQLLMLSGIGPRDHLESHGIPVLVDSPGVGSNLQDHPMTYMPFTTAPRTGFVYTRKDQVNRGLQDYVTKRKGLFSSPSGNLVGFARTHYALDSRPDVEYQIYGINPGGGLPASLIGHIYNLKPEIINEYLMPNILQDGFILFTYLIHPGSKGTVRLASSDPQDPPLIDHNLYTDRRDIIAMVEGMKLSLNITSAPALRQINARPYRGKVGDCDQYPLFSDPYLACFARTLTLTDYHPAGTVKMGAVEDPMAPLDPQLRVKGVRGLRVVDGSVMPEVVGGNTNAPIIMIAEKAADMIKGRSLRPSLPPFFDEDELLSYY